MRLPFSMQAPVCNVAPVGWQCTRPAGHEGPCAAVEQSAVPPLPHAAPSSPPMLDFFPPLGDPDKRYQVELSEPEINAIHAAFGFLQSAAAYAGFERFCAHYAPTMEALSERLIIFDDGDASPGRVVRFGADGVAGVVKFFSGVVTGGDGEAEARRGGG